jgi:prepilin-type N-terminal cleavage/methylation domain-containing protein
MKRTSTKGFTLIELMIVIAIIAILAAILIPNFLHARAQSVTAACEGNEKQIAISEEEYSVDHAGAYVILSGLTTPYIQSLPTNPALAGNAYSINITANPATYGSYQISDAGQHDSTSMVSIIQDGAAANCATCTSVVFNQNSGVRGK